MVDCKFCYALLQNDRHAIDQKYASYTYLHDMCTLSPWTSSPRASGVHVRQTTCVHGITIKYIHMTPELVIMACASLH